jgi:serine/threonine-protein kinase
LREKKQLMEALWPATFVEEVNLAYTVSALRKALGDGRDHPEFIETVPTKGYRFVGEVRRPLVELEAPKPGHPSAPTPAPSPTPPGGPQPTSWRRTALCVVLPTAVVTAALGGLIVGLIWKSQPSSPAAIVRTLLDIQPADEVDTTPRPKVPALTPTRGGYHSAFTWTPDGRSLVFVGYGNGTRQIYVRDLGSARARVLAGTVGARAVTVSPDGKTVVFLSGGAFLSDGAILRLPLGAGPVQTLASGVGSTAGLAAGVSGLVVFSRGGRIWRVSPETPPTPITSLARGETAHVLPQLLANDAVLLFTVRTSESTWGREQVVAQVLATGERKLLVRDAADARHVPGGRLVFLRRGLLMAAPFDLGRLAITGQPVPLLDGVSQSLTGANSNVMTGAGHFSISATGALAYVPSQVVPYAQSALVTVNRHGRVSTLPGDVRSYDTALRLSPDGRKLAVSTSSLTEHALWTLDLARGSLTKVTSIGEASAPRWTPDGQRMAFFWLTDGVSQVAWQRSDGSLPPETLARDLVPSSWSPDGRHLAAVKDDDLWVMTVGGGQPTVARVTETPEAEYHPEFSPDGRWLAYTSNATGRREVYLRPYPGPGPTIPVTVAGGTDPAWNPQGGELLYLVMVPGLQAGNPWGLRMMSVRIRDGRPGHPRRLFDFTMDLGLGCLPVRCYDVTADGQGIVAIRPVPRDPPPPVTHINLVLNWVDELKAKVPVN